MELPVCLFSSIHPLYVFLCAYFSFFSSFSDFFSSIPLLFSLFAITSFFLLLFLFLPFRSLSQVNQKGNRACEAKPFLLNAYMYQRADEKWMASPYRFLQCFFLKYSFLTIISPSLYSIHSPVPSTSQCRFLGTLSSFS